MSMRVTRQLLAEALRAQGGKRGKEFVQLVQQGALQGLFHLARHGDYGYALETVSALPNGVYRKALILWYMQFSSGKLRLWTDKKTGLLRASVEKNRQASDFDIEGAKRTPFTSWLPARSEGAKTMSKRARTPVSASNDVSQAPLSAAERMKRYKKLARESAKRWRAANSRGMRRVLSGGRVNPR